MNEQEEIELPKEVQNFSTREELKKTFLTEVSVKMKTN